MLTTTLTKTYTIEEFLELDLPENDEPYELLKGRIVSKKQAQGPSKEHGRIISNVVYYLKDHLKNQPLGEVFTGSASIVNGSYLKPDAAFWLANRVPLEANIDLPYPDLAIEVVSRSDVWFDVRDKAIEYLKAGTSLVWIIFWPNQEVYVYSQHSRKKMVTIEDSLEGSSILSGLTLAVSKLFEMPNLSKA